MLKHLIGFIILVFVSLGLAAQVTIEGTIKDKDSGDPLNGATVILASSTIGNISDFDGNFTLDIPKDPPFDLVVSYIGYAPQTFTITDASQKVSIDLEVASITTETVTIKGSRISEKIKESPQTVESLDIIAIRETPSSDFYQGLGNLKGVDVTTASLGFTVINTRGFNSTSPVRSLQIIDGVDNQAPGLNFSLGNFVGSPELDVQKVDIVVGANGAYYGPNAFNGVISMTTKDPIIHQGLSIMGKAGERNLLNGAVRYAKAFQNKSGVDKFAFKMNFSYLTANDWEAENYSETYKDNPFDYLGEDNPGGYDAVNVYGDEERFGEPSDQFQIINKTGIGFFHRKGYEEKHLVDYHTENIKANAALHYKFADNVELIGSYHFGSGTTVYQGDNRFSLKNLQFHQPKLELRKKDKFFLRGYYTKEDDGDTYDAYFTALRLLDAAKPNERYQQEYGNYWSGTVAPGQNWDYDFSDEIKDWPDWPDGLPINNLDAIYQMFEDSASVITEMHELVQDQVNNTVWQGFDDIYSPFYEPGTEEFNTLFNAITSSYNRTPKSGELGGTGFYDQSALWHVHGEYKFTPEWGDITVGGNVREFRPDSRGTIFSDSDSTKITNSEFGSYAGIEKKLLSNTLKINATMRMDKNENFDLLFSPAISAVFTASEKTILRLSASSAIRNPTLSDQYLDYNVGRAILLGNIGGINDLFTIESFGYYLDSLQLNKLEAFSVPAIQPEKVKSAELGIRTTISDNFYVDASYFFSFYDDFIGYNIGIDAEIDSASARVQSATVYRVAANASETVTTQGFSIGANYYFGQYYSFAGNYSWNKLNTDTNDPIVPAFNTPEHKFNIGVNARNMTLRFGQKKLKHVGFNVNYKWVDSFIYESSPQFTGIVPSYGLLDFQTNVKIPKWKSTIKIGASNVLQNDHFEVYGGPSIGRMGYISITTDLDNL